MSMTTPESRTPGQDEVAEGRNEVNRRINAINAMANEQSDEAAKRAQKEARDNLVMEVVGRFVQKDPQAGQAEQGVRQQQEIPQDQQQNAKEIHVAVAQLMELLDKGVITEESLTEIMNRMSAQNQQELRGAFLRGLKENLSGAALRFFRRIAQRGLNNKNALFIYRLLMRLATGDANSRIKIEFSQQNQQPTPFEQYFEELKTSNPDVARHIGQTIIELANSREGLPNLTPQLATQRFETTAPQPSEREMNAAVDNMRQSRRANEISVPPEVKYMMDRLKVDFEQIRNSFDITEANLIITNLQWGSDVAARIYEENFTQEDPQGQFFRNLLGRHIDLRNPQQQREHVRSLLAGKFGEQEADRIIRDAERYNSNQEVTGYIFSELDRGDRLRELLAKFYDTEGIFTLLFHQTQDSDNPRYEWNERGAKQILDYEREYIGLLFEKFDYVGSMEEGLNPMYEGRAVAALVRRLNELSRSSEIKARLSPEQWQVYQVYFNSMSPSIYKEQKMRQFLFQIPLIFKIKQPEEFGGFFAQVGLSEFSTLTSDRIVNKVMGIVKNYIQDVVIANGNRIPPNFFEGGYKQSDKAYERGWYSPYRQDVFNLISTQFRQLGGEYARLTTENNRWQIWRAITISYGVLMVDGEIPGILSNSRSPADFENLPFDGVISAINPFMKWAGEGGLRGWSYIREAWRFMLPVPHKVPDGKSWYDPSGWVDWIKFRQSMAHFPPELIKKGQQFTEDLEFVTDKEQRVRIIQDFLDDMEATTNGEYFFDAFREFGISGFADRGGYRIKGLKLLYEGERRRQLDNLIRRKAELPEKIKNEQDTVEKQKLTDELNAIPGKIAFLEKHQHWYGDAEMGKQWSEKEVDYKDIYQWLREEGLMYQWVVLEERMYKEFRSSKPKGMDEFEFRRRRTGALGGRAFYQLLLKDPLAFLNNIGQILNNVDDGYIKVGNEQVKASDFYLKEQYRQRGDLTKKPTGLEEIQVKVLRRIGTKFGAHNADSVKEMMDMYTDLYDWIRSREKINGEENVDVSGYGFTKDTDFNKVKLTARELLFNTLSSAHERVVQKIHNKKAEGKDLKEEDFQVKPEDIISPQIEAEIRQNFSPSEADVLIRRANKIKELMFGKTPDDEKGLIKHFMKKAENEKFVNEEKPDDFGTEDGFFHNTARAWARQSPHVAPNGDNNTNLLLERAYEGGENGLTRTLGDIGSHDKIQAAFAEAYSQVKKISLMGRDAPIEKALEGILKIHSEMVPLMDIYDADYMNRKQFELACMVIQAFREHWITRLPFMIGPMMRMLIGNHLSIPTQRPWGSSDKNIFTMTPDGIRWYISYLVKNTRIKETGPYSGQMLRQIFGVDNFTFWSEVTSHMTTAWAVAGLGGMVKKAFKDEQEAANIK